MSNDPVPGMIYPTQKGMLAGNPRDSAIQQGINSNAKLANMGKIGGKKRGGAVSSNAQVIQVPQYQMLYTPQGGNNSNPNAQIQQSAGISTQGAANAVYDKQALKGGSGKRRCKMGGTTNLSWGCYSGGKRRTKRSRKSRKSRTHRKSRKHYIDSIFSSFFSNFSEFFFGRNSINLILFILNIKRP